MVAVGCHAGSRRAWPSVAGLGLADPSAEGFVRRPRVQWPVGGGLWQRRKALPVQDGAGEAARQAPLTFPTASTSPARGAGARSWRAAEIPPGRRCWPDAGTASGSAGRPATAPSQLRPALRTSQAEPPPGARFARCIRRWPAARPRRWRCVARPRRWRCVARPRPHGPGVRPAGQRGYLAGRSQRRVLREAGVPADPRWPLAWTSHRLRSRFPARNMLTGGLGSAASSGSVVVIWLR